MDLATGTIFMAGLATFASPCVLPMIPIYLSVLVGGSPVGEETRGLDRLRLLLNGFMFVLGFTLVFVLLGLTATAVGRFFLKYRLLFQQLGGLVVFLFGLKFLGWLRIEALEREKRIQFGGGAKVSPGSAFVMGLTFAFGWTPCIGPILGAVLTYTAVSSAGILDGAWNLFLYAAGVGAPLLLIAVFAQQGMKLLHRAKRFLPRIEKATGVVMLAMAVLMITDSTSLLTFGVGDDASSDISVAMVDKTQPPTPVAVAAADSPTPRADDAESCDSGNACGIGGEAPVFGAGQSSSLSELAAGRPTVLYFHKPNCPACLKMTPIIQSMRETCSGRGLNVRKLDVSQSSERAVAGEHAVRGTPTMVFVDGGGTEVARLVGAVDFDAVHGATAVLMGEVCADFTVM